jgi:hypothetical protein
MRYVALKAAIPCAIQPAISREGRIYFVSFVSFASTANMVVNSGDSLGRTVIVT